MIWGINMASKRQAAVRRTAETPDTVPAQPILPPEMEGRADARELREFVQAFLSIDDPQDRRRILEAVRDAAS